MISHACERFIFTLPLTDENEPDNFSKFSSRNPIGQNSNLVENKATIWLAIVKSVVEQHGGLASMESELIKGSCFRVSLPILQSRSITAEAS